MLNKWLKVQDFCKLLGSENEEIEEIREREGEKVWLIKKFLV